MFGVGLTLPKISAVLLNAIGGLLAAYKINDLTPDLVADFNGSLNDNTEFYDAGGTVDTFAELITHSRAGNATMTNGYGPELVTNSGFDSDSDWALGTGVTISGGKLLVNTTSAQNTTQQIPVELGQAYEISFTISDYVSGAIRAQVGGITTWFGSNGLHKQTVVTTASPQTFVLATGGNPASMSIDNVSVRKVPAIKWASHNLLKYSEDLTATSWFTTGTGTVADSFTVSLSGSDSLTSDFTTTQVGASYTVEVELWTETDIGKQVDFGFSTNNLSNTFSAPITLTATPTTYSFSKSNNTATQNGFRLRNYGGTTKTVKVSKVRLYRSDLGGMVDNPDRGDSYVPTTSSAVYLPRRNHHVYNGDAWVNEGVLHESEARTNLVTYSQDFTDSSWTNQNVATLALDSVGPDGHANSAVKLIDNGAGGSGVVRVSDSVTVSTSTDYTFSVYAKKDQLHKVLLYTINFTNPANNGYVFDLTDGTYTAYAGSPADLTPSSEYVGNGWYRCSLTFTTDASDTDGNISIYAIDVTAAVPLDGTSSILIYGAQFESGSTPSSLIPTNGATVSRALDTLTIPAANMPWPGPNIDPLSVSIQMQGRVTYADEGSTVEVALLRWSYGINYIRHYLRTDSTKTGMLYIQQNPGSVLDVINVSGLEYSPGVLVPFNIASRHGSTFLNGAADSVSGAVNTTPLALPDLSATDFNLGYDYMGTISMLRVWADDLADVGIAEATEPSEVPSLQLTFDNSETSFTIQDWEQ